MFLFPGFHEYKDSKERFSESLELLNQKRELAEEVKSFEYVGYAYIKYNLAFKSDMIHVPLGEILTEKEIEEELTPLQFGDKKQIKALEYLEYLQLARKYYKNNNV